MSKSDAVRLVLEKLVELYDVDTTVIWPDDPLEQFGISFEMSRKVLHSCLMSLDGQFQNVDFDEVTPRTARDLVESVYQFSSLSNRSDRVAA